MGDEVKEKARALLQAVLDRDEGADVILSTLSEDEAEEIRDEFELAGHLLDVHLGYAERCPDYVEEMP